MTRSITVCLALLFLVAFGVGAAPAGSASSSPPQGLTDSGRDLWNLDALLHDTFGNRAVYLTPGPASPTSENFTTHFIDEANSYLWIYTFADARHSAFRPLRPTVHPKPYEGTAGWQGVVKVSGAYVSCGRNLWLYQDGGEGDANDVFECLKSP
jgi:hypothetical protein